MRIAISGPGRSGKDTAAEWLRDHTRLRFTVATSSIIAPVAAKKLGVSAAEMFRIRHDHRKLMYDTGVEMRKGDPAFLARTVVGLGDDIVVGIRDRDEMLATVRDGLVDLVLWVDRPGIPPDPTITYGPELADVVVYNHWGLPELYARLARLAKSWGVLRAS